MLSRFVYILISFLFLGSAYSQDTQYVKMGAEAFEVDGKNILAITLENTKKWHTYWKNPGDAGLEVKLNFSVNDKKVKLNDYAWPAPKRYIEQGNMWAFGYGGKYALFFELKDSLKATNLKIVGTWLVCKDICIPGTRTVNLALSNTLRGDQNSILSQKELLSIFKRLPQVDSNPNIELFLTKGFKENQLAIHYIIEDADFSLINTKVSLLTPYLRPPFDFKHEEVYLDPSTNTIYGRTYVDWDGIYDEPIWNLPKDGVFKAPIDTRFLFQYPKGSIPKIITKSFAQFTLKGDKELSKRFETLMILDYKNNAQPLPKTSMPSSFSIFYFLLFGFLGGIILNIMPCVLPVISLKLFGLIVHSEESKKQILKHNLAYTAGVLATFLTLASVIVALKMSGDHIGWGFQLQSPTFVFIMLMVIFIMALNMLGLFEFITPGGKSIGNAEIKKGILGDFVNGILATILSTPCSAPFLGTALTFAFTTSHVNVFLIFTSIGLGLAFPFIMTGFFPSLIKFLPKPGMWMDKLKRFLGLSLLLTAVWLIDVLFSIIDFQGIGIYFNTLLVVTFFAIYLRQKITKNLAINIIVFLLPVYFTYEVVAYVSSDSSIVSAHSGKKSLGTGVQWEEWTPTKMKTPKLRFINFTASWCLTCKVNKKLVLNTSSFQEFIQEKEIQLLEGDWTRRDENISKFLAKYNIYGVPAYFIQKEDGSIISLGETISLGKIKKYIK